MANGIFTNMWEEVLADELPDDNFAEMEMNDDLRKLKISKNKDPKELPLEMAAIEAEYKCTMTGSKKAAVVL